MEFSIVQRMMLDHGVFSVVPELGYRSDPHYTK